MYCLLGICDVNVDLRDREGKDRAWHRLGKEVRIDSKKRAPPWHFLQQAAVLLLFINLIK